MNTKHRTRFLPCYLAALLLLLASSPVRADDDEDIDPTIFYEKLAPYGTWVDHPQYHRVWYPRDVPRGWRPYTHGHWVHTHLHGWMWQSDWEWGWAPFHYGRWAFDDDYGWIWVPGSVWGPAWVTWRSGGSYIGWAPLPPEVGWHDEHGLQLEHVDLNTRIAPTHWIFIEEQHFLRPRMHQHIFRPANNFAYVRDTQHITHFNRENGHIVNHFLPTEQIERVTRQPVHTVHLREVHNVTDARHTRNDDHALPVFRPRINTSRLQEQPIKPYTTQNRPAHPREEIKAYRPSSDVAEGQNIEKKNIQRMREQPIKPYTTQNQPVSPHKEIKEHHQRNDADGQQRSEDSTIPRRQEQPIKPYSTQSAPVRPRKEITGSQLSDDRHDQPRSSEHGSPVIEDKKAIRQQQKTERKAQKQHDKEQHEQDKREQREQKKFEHKSKSAKERD